MRQCIPFVLLALILSACEEKPAPISIQVFPAILAADARGEAVAWDSVSFAGSERSPEAVYRVAPEPLFTEWNIIAFRTAAQPGGAVAVAARLNAYAARKLQEFSRNPDHLKKPLAVKINGRWADFMPLLSWIEDRIILYGFIAEETEQLQHYIDNK
ncbi:MAG: hypothetical protein HOC74_13185 [Gemmatimonadetes bacterium]|mgnify:CR=1 FL=1|jgi:hypothetical protein|nr:hypothetical protein [Gemmatimonadota bacterium]